MTMNHVFSVALAFLGMSVLASAMFVAGMALTLTGPYGGPSKSERVGAAALCCAIAVGGFVLFTIGVRMWP